MLASLALLGSLLAAEPPADGPADLVPVQTVALKPPRSLMDTSGSADMGWGARWASFGASSAGCALGAGAGVGAYLGVAYAAERVGSDALGVLTIPLIPAGCALAAGGMGRWVNGRSFEAQVAGALMGELIALPVLAGAGLVVAIMYVDGTGWSSRHPRAFAAAAGALLVLPPLAVIGGWTTRAANRAPQARPRLVPVADLGGGEARAPGLLLEVRW